MDIVVALSSRSTIKTMASTPYVDQHKDYKATNPKENAIYRANSLNIMDHESICEEYWCTTKT